MPARRAEVEISQQTHGLLPEAGAGQESWLGSPSPGPAFLRQHVSDSLYQSPAQPGAPVQAGCAGSLPSRAARCLALQSFTGGRALPETERASGKNRRSGVPGPCRLPAQPAEGSRQASAPAPLHLPLASGRASLESLTRRLYHRQKHNSPLMIITGFPAALLFRGAGAFLVAIGAV